MKSLKLIGLFLFLTAVNAMSSFAYTLTSAQVQTMSTAVANFVVANGDVPNYSTAPNGSLLSPTEMFFVMSRWIASPGSLYVYKGTGAAPNPNGALTNGNVLKAHLITSSQNAANYITTYGRLPNYITVNGVQSSPAVFYTMMAKAIKYYQANGVLPNYVTAVPCANPASWHLPVYIGKSFFILGTDAQSFGIQNVVNKAATNGIKDIFLLVKGAGGTIDFSKLATMLPLAHAKDIRVHAWVICFQDNLAYASGQYNTVGTGWIDPADTNYRDDLMDAVITPLLASYPIDGIILDYIRYPGNANGNTNAINSFLADIKAAANAIAPSVLLSAAVMPEMSANAFYYGQNYAQMSQYLDALLPMTYTYNFGQPASWIGTVVDYMVDRVAATCQVQAILQTKNGSANKSSSDLNNERSIAENNGSEINVSYFSWPFTTSQWTSVSQ